MRTKWSFISIHAPHARSDQCVFAVRCFPQYFNPRSSCEERRKFLIQIKGRIYFNPRSSCEERLVSSFLSLISFYFNPRSSCEERHKRVRFLCVKVNFNPRSSCEERLEIFQITLHKDIFQSTLLMRGATPYAFHNLKI